MPEHFVLIKACFQERLVNQSLNWCWGVYYHSLADLVQGKYQLKSILAFHEGEGKYPSSIHLSHPVPTKGEREKSEKHL